MSLCDDRGLFATDKEMVRRRSVAALRDIDAVSHKNHRSACRQINQRFLKLTQPAEQNQHILFTRLYSLCASFTDIV